jgi:hypothetical protein
VAVQCSTSTSRAPLIEHCSTYVSGRARETPAPFPAGRAMSSCGGRSSCVAVATSMCRLCTLMGARCASTGAGSAATGTTTFLRCSPQVSSQTQVTLVLTL